ncbi:MAG: CBS domain-containing protein [Pseudomonadota bacterium]
MRVSDILKAKGQAPVTTMAPGAAVTDAAQILSKNKIGTVVVSADGRSPDGVVSERDIVRELGRRGPSCLDDRLSDLMTRKVVTCAPTDDVSRVLEKMTEGRFRHMPVVDDGAMVGLVSLGDVVKAQLREVAAEKDALTDMIMGHG